jgi:hypothetical protein
MASDERGKRLLKDLARSVREKITPAGVPQLDERGLGMLDDLARELGGPDAMPGLSLWRDAQNRFRLTRANRNAEISLEWQKNIGALVLTMERANHPRKQIKYLFDEGESAWKPLNGAGELYQDLTEGLVEFLYPEVKK